jgi:hypothetical protein
MKSAAGAAAAPKKKVKNFEKSLDNFGPMR